MRLLGAFGNIGRGTPEQTRRAVATIADQLGDARLVNLPSALFLNEVDEADPLDEHGLIGSAFRQWDATSWQTREPVLYRGLDVIRQRSVPAAPGLARQTPARNLHMGIIEATPRLVTIAGHYPAGARNGQRSPLVRAELVAGYLRMLARHRAAVHHHAEAGHIVLYGMDVNARWFPRLHRREVPVAKHGPDLIRIVPPRGYTVTRGMQGATPLYETQHRLIWSVIDIRKERP